MPTKEKNEVRMVGVLPSQGADPIPVEIAAWGHSPLSIAPPAFIPALDSYDWDHSTLDLKNRTALTTQYFNAALCFPDEVTVATLTLYGYRDDAAATISATLYRMDRAGGLVAMAAVTADWATGYSSKSNSVITSPIIDNVNYGYVLIATLNPNDSVNDVKLSGVTITFS